jgi:thiol-disulfide isomerase/thioredoxin
MNSFPASAMRGRAAVIIVVAVAAAAALGFFLQRYLTRPSMTPDPAAEVASTDPQPASAEAAPEGASIADPKVPEVLPQFELLDRDGKPRKLADWAGRPVAVNYWATWCAPCRREIPLLNSLRKQRAAQKLEIIGIAVDFRDDVLKYAAETVIDYPLLIGEEDGLEAVKAVGMQPAFPFTVFADSKQRIVALKVGELHQDEADLILDRVADVDAGRLELSAARDQISEGLKELATRRAATESATTPGA